MNLAFTELNSKNQPCSFIVLAINTFDGFVVERKFAVIYTTDL